MSSIRSFVKLLRHFLSGRATPKDEEIIEKWYSALDEENNFPRLSSHEADAMHAEDYESLRRRIKGRTSRMLVIWPSLAAAAAVLFVAIFFLYQYRGDLSDQSPTASTKEFPGSLLQAGDSVYNGSDSDLEVWLADSSSVTLKSKSFITVARLFNKEGRNVTLKGEGFFKIRRDERRPFRVFTYGIVTQVLGTSFTVRAPSEHEQIAVEVKTGRVAVRRMHRDMEEPDGAGSDRVVLTPNQQVTFDPTEKRLAPSLVEKPVPLVREEKTRKVYDDAAVGHVLEDISDIYGIEISCDDQVRSARITTAFGEEEGLYDRLDILTKAIGAHYWVNGTEIIIESNGR